MASSTRTDGAGGAAPARRARFGLATLAATVLLSAGLAACGGSGSSGDAKAARPNIVFVLTDDMRYDALSQLPMLAGRKDTAVFDRAYVEEPQCCPSRATTLTGRYSSHTGVDTLRSGAKLDDSKTVATMLHAAGYRTGLFGKYLNGFPLKGRSLTPPGWDDFNAYEGATNYGDYTLDQNGTARHYGTSQAEYSTDVFTDLAVGFIRDTPEDQPFFVYVPYNAPHLDAKGDIPASARFKGSCAGQPALRLPSWEAHDKGPEPPWMADAKRLGPYGIALQDDLVTKTCEALKSVDAGIEKILGELERDGRLADTYVVFASDNGFSFGEHRLCCKGHLYEESVHVPLLVFGPGVKPGPVHRLTSNIDYTPTLLDLAGVEPPSGFVDGTSFVPELRGLTPAKEPDAVLLRGCRTQRSATSKGDDDPTGPVCGGHREKMPNNWGLRTDRYKYIEYPDGFVQLFDLQADPYEMDNIGERADQRALVARLHAELVRMRGS